MTDNPNPIEPPFFKAGLKFLQINANTFKIESEITCEYILGHKDIALFFFYKKKYQFTIWGGQVNEEK